MTEPGPPDIVSLFLAGADVIALALRDHAVADTWDRPSVLEDQSVGGLAGHLARSGIWVVGEYLDAGVPPGPVDFSSAGEYYAMFVGPASTEAHQAIRDRGAAVALAGVEALLRRIDDSLGELRPRLQVLDGDHLISVAGGNVMRLDDSLTTRIVEQTVHLDDLARSIGCEPWPLPTGAMDLTVAVGTEIGSRRVGTTAMMRALYRGEFARGALPVLDRADDGARTCLGAAFGDYGANRSESNQAERS